MSKISQSFLIKDTVTSPANNHLLQEQRNNQDLVELGNGKRLIQQVGNDQKKDSGARRG